MRELVKLHETAHIPIQTHENHGLYIPTSNDHKTQQWHRWAYTKNVTKMVTTTASH
jgi:hypothetical protein